MKIITPDHYHKFRCLASACPDSCCKEWAVQVDSKAAELYRALPGELGDRLRQVMQEEDGDTILALESDGRCPMWRDAGLCRIHAQLGEAALCDTCRDFPRLRHDYGDFVELGLELSCPEAARLILQERKYETSTVLTPEAAAPEYDTEAMEILLRSREVALRFLEDTEYPIGQALAVLLLYGYDVQNELDGGDPAGLDAPFALAEAAQLTEPGTVDEILEFYKGLEILTPLWHQRLDAPSPAPWTDEFRALARYFVARYWLQAVADYDLVCRVKLAVVSCLVVKALGGNVIDTAQLYSKEIENDADNVEALLDGAYTAPALTDKKLLWLLLRE